MGISQTKNEICRNTGFEDIVDRAKATYENNRGMRMKTDHFLNELSSHMSHLFAFARQINEADFAGALNGEFRGCQDPGWATTITADQVFHELVKHANAEQAYDEERLRIVLMLYCQLSEAGGAYETLKNMMGVITLKPYNLWPFQDLVRVRNAPKRIIGPNANATFKDLATTANNIGMSRLAEMLETVFRDDIRNGISHADYVIWNDGLRLRKRNGGHPSILSFQEVMGAIERGVGFFQILKEMQTQSVKSFHPPKNVVARFSSNPPMEWTISWNPSNGSFQFRTSAPGPSTTPELLRQEHINNRLDGRVLALYTTEGVADYEPLLIHIRNAGFDPNIITMAQDRFTTFIQEIRDLKLWDERSSDAVEADVVILSPWGFRWGRVDNFDGLLEEPMVEFVSDPSMLHAPESA